MFIIKLISKTLALLNSEETPLQIALGIALGAIIAITPFLSLHNVVVFFFLCILNVSFKAGFLGMFILAPLGLILTMPSHNIGSALLIDNASLAGFWTSIQAMPFLPFFKFNNTVTLGSLVLSLILFLPLTVIFYFVVRKYRDSWREKFLQTKLYKVLSKSKYVGWVVKIYKLIPG